MNIKKNSFYLPLITLIKIEGPVSLQMLVADAVTQSAIGLHKVTIIILLFAVLHTVNGY